MTWPEHLPKLCPGCGSPYSEHWVRGFWGWTCGSFHTSHRALAPIDLNRSIDCAVIHWKTRALKAEKDNATLADRLSGAELERDHLGARAEKAEKALDKLIKIAQVRPELLEDETRFEATLRRNLPELEQMVAAIKADAAVREKDA